MMTKTITLEKFLILKKNLKEGQKVRIVSGSMEPFIGVDELIEVNPYNNKNLRD